MCQREEALYRSDKSMKGVHMVRALAGLLLALFGTIIPAQAADRQQQLRAMIEEHRQKAETVGAGIDTSEVGHLGTAFNEMGVNEFMCASLAFLFEKDAIFKRLGTIEETPHETYLETPLAVKADSLLHTNWALAADNILSMSQRDRIETWNLDCVRQYDITQEEAMPRIAPTAEFEVHEDQLHVLGDIDPGFYERFVTILAKHPEVKYVALGSGGGSVRDAILAGLLIRKKRLDTTLVSDCYSACPLLYLGGANRTIWSPYRRLGFHQASHNGKAVPTDDNVYELIRKYATSMGADGSFLLAQMHSSTPENMTYPEVEDLCKSAITTWVQRACWAD
jgi:hypothetical protein